MRGLRFVILLLVAIPLGWYAYYDSKKGPVDDSPKRDKVFAVDADKIDELEIRSESGEKTTLRRKGSDWDIVQPVASPSDQAKLIFWLSILVIPGLILAAGVQTWWRRR